VYDIFKLSANEIEKIVRNLDLMYQYIGEMSKGCYSRFEFNYGEIKGLGHILNDGELGAMVFKGILSLNRQILRSFMANQNIVCNLEKMETMCDYLSR